MGLADCSQPFHCLERWPEPAVAQEEYSRASSRAIVDRRRDAHRCEHRPTNSAAVAQHQFVFVRDNDTKRRPDLYHEATFDQDLLSRGKSVTDPLRSDWARTVVENMRAYVINMARSSQRRANMIGQLTRYQIDFEIIEAVDGRQVNLTDAETLRSIAPSFADSDCFLPAVVACAMSHLNAHQKILADGADWGLVLEDDVIISADLCSLAEAVAGQLVGAEVGLLNFDSPRPLKMRREDVRDLPSSRHLLLPADVSHLASGAAYIITREACARFAERGLPIRGKPDEWGRFCTEGILDRVRCVFPLAVRKNPNFTSTIWYYSNPGLKTRVLEIIARHDLRIFQRVVSFRRKRIWRRYNRVSFLDERITEKSTER